MFEELPTVYQEAGAWVKSAIDRLLEVQGITWEGFIYLGWYNGTKTPKGEVIDTEYNPLSKKFRFGIRAEGSSQVLYYSKREF